MKFQGHPVVLNEHWRLGLFCVTEDGHPEALIDVGKGAALSAVTHNANWLSNQRHAPRIAIECSAETAAKYLKARVEQALTDVK